MTRNHDPGDHDASHLGNTSTRPVADDECWCLEVLVHTTHAVHRCSSSGAPCILCAALRPTCICVYRSKDPGGPRCNDPHHDPGDHDTGHLGIHYTSRPLAANEMFVSLLHVPSLCCCGVLALLPAGHTILLEDRWCW